MQKNLTFLVRLLWLHCLLALFAVLLPMFNDSAVIRADVVRVIIGMCGTFGVLYYWTPRAVAWVML